MEKLFSCRINADEGELPGEKQTTLDKLAHASKRFDITECFYDSVTVYINKSGVYMYSTSEVANSNLVECSLSKVKTLKELHDAILRKRGNCMESTEIWASFQDLAAYANSLDMRL